MSKTPVIFHLRMPTMGVSTPRLPMEVRRPNLSLVERGLTAQAVYLDLGVYFVTITLPDGQELIERVEIEAKAPTEISLGQNSDLFIHPIPPPRALTSLYALRLGDGRVGRDQESLYLRAFDAPGRRGAKLRLFREELPWKHDLNFTSEEASLRLVQVDELSWRVEGLAALPSNSTYLAQLVQRDAVPTNLLFATGELPDLGCRVLLVQQPGGEICLNAELTNADANVLLAFLGMGRLHEAATMATSDALTSEVLLRDKRKDPLAAAVGAYALLRLGNLDQLHDWTENLRNWFPWLPDGLTVRGEHLARLGEHEKALDVFLELPRRGLPLFSEGFFYAVDRLRSYLSIAKASFPHQKVNRAVEVLTVLQRFEPYVDVDQPFLSFTGLDPGVPDRKVLNEERWLYQESSLRP